MQQDLDESTETQLTTALANSISRPSTFQQVTVPLPKLLTEMDWEAISMARSSSGDKATQLDEVLLTILNRLGALTVPHANDTGLRKVCIIAASVLCYPADRSLREVVLACRRLHRTVKPNIQSGCGTHSKVCA